jgi:hypothetical protein
MIPEVKKFSRAEPCTKLDIWNAFRGKRGFVRVLVVDARAVIGANVPKILLEKGRILHTTSGSGEFYELTEKGAAWLEEGMNNYVEQHPEDLIRVKHPRTSWLPKTAPVRARRRRRS